jgi:hypothetical protein
MFIEIEELKTAIYAYQIEQITEADDDIVFMALTAAEDEVASYLRPNSKGLAPAYDVATVFGATGTGRSAMLMQIVKTVAVWNIVQLCNVDIIYENAKERYDRALTWLRRVSLGETVLELPLITTGETSDLGLAFRTGGRLKFIHE